MDEGKRLSWRKEKQMEMWREGWEWGMREGDVYVYSDVTRGRRIWRNRIWNTKRIFSWHLKMLILCFLTTNCHRSHGKAIFCNAATRFVRITAFSFILICIIIAIIIITKKLSPHSSFHLPASSGLMNCSYSIMMSIDTCIWLTTDVSWQQTCLMGAHNWHQGRWVWYGA